MPSILTLPNRNLEKVILGAYKFLSNNYEDGDRINLIGTLDELFGLLPT
jgi:uncharacterized protein (DUF2235 family)